MATRAPSERRRWWCLAAFCLSAALSPAAAKPPDLPVPFEHDFTAGEARQAPAAVPADNAGEMAEGPEPSMADRCEAMRRLTRCALFVFSPVAPALPMRHVIEYGIEPPYPVLCVGEREYSARGFFTAAAVAVSTGPFGPFWLEVDAVQAPKMPPAAVPDHDPRFLFGGAIIVGPWRRGGAEEAEAVEKVPVMPEPARPCEGHTPPAKPEQPEGCIPPGDELSARQARQLLILADAYTRLGFLGEARKCCEMICALCPDSGYACQAVGRIAALCGYDCPDAGGGEMPVVCAGYEVTDLLTVYEAAWDRKADLLILVKKHRPEELAKELIALIRDGIAPETWDARGGPGTVEFNADLNTLFVNQTEAVHDKVRAFLAARRKDNDLRKENCARQVIKVRAEAVTLTGCAEVPVAGAVPGVIRAYREVLEMVPPRLFIEAPELFVDEEECELVIIEGGQKRKCAEPAGPEACFDFDISKCGCLRVRWQVQFGALTFRVDCDEKGGHGKFTLGIGIRSADD